MRMRAILSINSEHPEKALVLIPCLMLVPSEYVD